jgi:hypothetical protein
MKECQCSNDEIIYKQESHNCTCSCKKESISDLIRIIKPFHQKEFITVTPEKNNFNPIINFWFVFDDIKMNISKLKEGLVEFDWWNNHYNLINNSYTYENESKVFNFSLVYKVEDENYDLEIMLKMVNNILKYFKTLNKE